MLDQARYVVNHNDIDPQTQPFMWKGPADLSARAWVWHEQGKLHLRLDVRDDVHRQKHAASRMWQGDSIQLGLAVPGQVGYWELGFAMSNSGKLLTHVWLRPEGTTSTDPRVDSAVTRIDGDNTRYKIALDLEKLCTKDGSQPDQIAISFAINDDDSDRREGFMQLTPGIATQKSPALFMPIAIE